MRNYLFKGSVQKLNHVTYFMMQNIHGPKVCENMHYELQTTLKKIIMLIYLTNHIGGKIVCLAHITRGRYLVATFSAQSLSLSSMLPGQLLSARERSGTHVITGLTHAKLVSLTSPCCSGWPARMNTPQGQQRELSSDGCADFNAWLESDLLLIINFNSTHK